MTPNFPEMNRLETLAAKAGGIARIETLAKVRVGDQEFPVLGVVIGSTDKSKPTLGLFGGVHGLEVVGTHVLLAYFEAFVERWRWDEDLAKRFEDVRIVSIPIVNPGGMFLGNRSNPSGIDLMRNAPVEAAVKTPFILGGHRYSRKLPYFRGDEGKPMEIEAQALVDFVKAEMFPSTAALAVDMHSGFGHRDRLWFPYARTTDQFPRSPEVESIHRLLNASHPNHVYKVEPQSVSYTTHGDLWDYLFDSHVAEFGLGEKVFIPWTLEMGSWAWIRKNPAQLFSALGPFNPIKAHRLRRTMRRHMPLIEFFLRVVKNHKAWQSERPLAK